jgi:hypothetical protein
VFGDELGGGCVSGTGGPPVLVDGYGRVGGWYSPPTCICRCVGGWIDGGVHVMGVVQEKRKGGRAEDGASLLVLFGLS